MRRGIDLTGLKFGRLTGIKQIENPKNNGALWLFLCDCGIEKIIKGQPVRLGAVVSCGCRKKETLEFGRYVHGNARHPLYGVWKSMISRCNNVNDKDYSDYGGRGIKVCKQWLNNPESFFNDMGNREKRSTLDRIDNNGNYEPANCRWATPLQQGANKRNNHVYEINGENLHHAEVCRRFDIPESTLSNRIKSGMTINDAISKPIRRRK